MRLEEKIHQRIKYHTGLYKSNLTKEISELADDYAIEFVEWLYKWDNTRLPNGNWIIRLGIKPYTSEEVLEIFKKEKEL